MAEGPSRRGKQLQRQEQEEEQPQRQQRQVQEENLDAIYYMENLIETLKIMEYETSLCSNKGLKPLNRIYFATQQPNSAEQFIYFISLCSWLFTQNGLNSSLDKYDEANSAANTIMVECKKLGLEFDFPSAKLKPGFGDAVCIVLTNLAERALKARKYQFKAPIFPQEQGGDMDIQDEEDPGMVEDLAADSEGEVPFANEVQQSETIKQEEQEKQTLIYSHVDPNEWMREVERVANKLKVNQNNIETKEWRQHMEQAKNFQKFAKKEMQQNEQKLNKIQEDISKALEKITKKEQTMNKSNNTLAQDYQAQATQLSQLTTRYKQINENVADLNQQLNMIQDKLDEYLSAVEQQSTGMTDTGPLVQIKQAMQNLRTEISQMEIRIGVVNHSLLQAKLKERV